MCDVMPGLNAPRDSAESLPESSELANMQESLWFEDRNGPPALSDTEMSKLDGVADEVEIQRLIAKGVIRPQQPEDRAGEMQKLSTKFVRTWRAKRKSNRAMQLRRSRLVAREYRWLDSTREGLFSPSTSSSIVRLLPLLFCIWRATRPEEQIVLATIDIKDAFLEVPQEHPVIAGLPSDYMGEGKFIFLKCIPGQRNGTTRWFDFYTNFLKEHLQVQSCSVCPAVMRTDGGPFLVHVDDNQVLCPMNWLQSVFIPILKSRFEISVEVAWRVGDQISFLKRLHTITETGIRITLSEQYALNMAKILGARPSDRAQTPDLAQFAGHDSTPLLSETDGSKFRSVVGIALYVSADRPDIAHAVRLLSSVMSKPTQMAWRAAVRLTQYLLNTATYALHLEPGEPGTSVLHGLIRPGCDLLETYTDADWAGTKANRRSIGCAVHLINGAVVHFATRTQRSISLSSMESEWYACVSGCCDSVYIREVWQFITGESCSMRVCLDNQSARAVGKRQGVPKQAKHIAGRLLWIQDYVKRGVFELAPVHTAYNLSDIGTKALSKSRLKALLYLHNFVQGDADERVGVDEYNDLVQQQLVRAQVRRVKSAVLRGNASNANLFMLMCTLMPLLGQASDSSDEFSLVSDVRTIPAYSGYGAAHLCIVFCLGILIPMIGWCLNWMFTATAHDDLPSANVTPTSNASVSEPACLRPPLSWDMPMLDDFVCNASLSLSEWGFERVCVWVVLLVLCFKLLFAKGLEPGNKRVNDKSVQCGLLLDGDIPLQVSVTKHGDCYHRISCGHVKGSGTVKQFRRCTDCFG